MCDTSDIGDWITDDIADDFLGVVPGKGGIVGDFLEDTTDYLFHGGLEDDVRAGLRWIDDEIINPVYEFQKGMFQSFADDLIYAAAVAFAVATGQLYLLPYITAIKTKSDGGSWGDAVVAGVKSWAVQQVATAPAFETAGNAVGSTIAEALGGGEIAVAVGDVVAGATQVGLASGTVQVISGESFSDGFSSAFIGSVVNVGTGKILDFVESKLPDGLKYTTEVKNENGNILDKDGRRVYRSKPDGSDDLTRAISDNGVVRKAQEVLETFPPVVQEMISTSIAAELQGKEVTAEMMYGIAAKAFVTTEAVGSVIDKIPGVDFNSPEGQNILTFITPAVQQSVAQAASMGLNEESGYAFGQNLMQAIQDYGNAKLFENTLEFVADSPVMQDVFAVVDTLTGKTSAAKAAAEEAEAASNALAGATSEIRAIENEQNKLYNEYVIERQKFEESGGIAYRQAADRWRASYDEDGVIKEGTAGEPANLGFTSFQDYYTELAQVEGYASLAQLNVGRQTLTNAENAFTQHKNKNASRMEELIGQVGEGGELVTDYQTKYGAFQAAESIMLTDLNELGQQIIDGLIPEVQRDLVLTTNPSFDEEYYEEEYGDQFQEGMDAFAHFTIMGAKEGKFVSQGQADAFEAQAKEQFKLQVAGQLSAGNGIGYLNGLSSDANALADFNADVDAMWQANFYDEFDNFQSYKFETLQYTDLNGSITDNAYSQVPVYATLTAEEAAVGDRGWDKVVNEDGSETFFLLENGERVVSGYDNVLNDYGRKVPDAWSDMATTVATGLNFYDPNEFNFMFEEQARQDLVTQQLDGFNAAELASILSGGGIAFGASGDLNFVPPAKYGDEEFAMFDPLTGEANYIVEGVSLDYIKEVDNRSYLDLFSAGVGAFADRVGVSADAYNADKLLAVELEQMVADGVIDTATALTVNVAYINNEVNLLIAEGLTNAGLYLVEGAQAQFDPDNPYGLLDWSDEGVTAKFDMWKAAGDNFANTVKQLPQDTVQAGKTTGALALQGVSELGQSFLGMARFMGQNPESLPAYQFLENMVVLGEDWKSDDWKAGADKLNASLAGRGIDDPTTPQNEAIWGTMRVIGGAFADNPIEFLGEVIFREGIQEIVPLVVGGGMGYAAGRGGAKLVHKELSEKFARNLGFGAAISLDIAESAGGTVEGAYDEAYDVVRASLVENNDVTGYSTQQIDIMAERYAQDIAVKNGTYAAMTTAAMMLAGGAALEKLSFGAGKIDETAFRTWGTRLNAAKATAGKESISEFVEEFVINDHMEGMLYEWDDTRNVTGNNWFAGTMGAVIAGPVTGTMAAVMQPNPDAAAIGFTIPDSSVASGTRQFASTGNVEADLLIQFNPNIAAAVYNNAPTLEADLDALGVNYGVYSALGDAANDPDFTGNPLTLPNMDTGVDNPAPVEPDFTQFPSAEAANDNLHYDVLTDTTYRFTDGTWEARGAGDNVLDRNAVIASADATLDSINDYDTHIFTDPVSGTRYIIERRVVDGSNITPGLQKTVVTKMYSLADFSPSQEELHGIAKEIYDDYTYFDPNYSGGTGGVAPLPIGFISDAIAKAQSMGMDSYHSEPGVTTLRGLIDTTNIYAEMLQTALETQDQTKFDVAFDIYNAVASQTLPVIKSERQRLGLSDDGDTYDSEFFNASVPTKMTTMGANISSGYDQVWKGDTYELQDFTVDTFLEQLHGGRDVIGDGTGQYAVYPKSTIPFIDIEYYEESVRIYSERAAAYQKIMDTTFPYTQEGRDTLQYYGTLLGQNAVQLEDAEEELLQKREDKNEADADALAFFRAKSVENGWSVSDASNYVLRNGQDIAAAMKDMTIPNTNVLDESKFDNYFVNNTDASKNFANIDASPKLSLNQFKDILIKDNGLTEDEYYAALGAATLGGTREEVDNNTKAYFLDAVHDFGTLDAFGNPVVGLRPDDSVMTDFLLNTVITEEQVRDVYKEQHGPAYEPTAEELARYVGATFSLDEDNNAVYDNTIDDITNAINLGYLNPTEQRLAIFHVFGILEQQGRDTSPFRTAAGLARLRDLIDVNGSLDEAYTAVMSEMNNFYNSSDAEAAEQDVDYITTILNSFGWSAPVYGEGGRRSDNPTDPRNQPGYIDWRETGITNNVGRDGDMSPVFKMFSGNPNEWVQVDGVRMQPYKETRELFASLNAQGKEELLRQYYEAHSYTDAAFAADLRELFPSEAGLLDRVLVAKYESLRMGNKPKTDSSGVNLVWDDPTNPLFFDIQYPEYTGDPAAPFSKTENVTEIYTYFSDKTEVIREITQNAADFGFDNAADAVGAYNNGELNDVIARYSDRDLDSGELLDLLKSDPELSSGLNAALTYNEFKSAMINNYGLTEDEFYASMGDDYGATNQDIDTNLEAAFTAERYSFNSELLSTYLDGVINTTEEVTAAYREKLGANYNPTAGELAAYVGTSFTLDEDNNRVNDRSIQELLKSFTDEGDVVNLMRSLGYERYYLVAQPKVYVYAIPIGVRENGTLDVINKIAEEDVNDLFTFGRTSQADNIAAFEAYVAAAGVDENGYIDTTYSPEAELAAQKRTETITAFGDYNPSEEEIAQFLDNNAGIAQYVDDNTITQAEVKQSLEDQGFVVPEDFNYDSFIGKKPESGLAAATKSWRDGNTVTEDEVKRALEARGFTVPEDFNYDAFTGKNKPDTGTNGEVDTYLEPRQYTREEAKADLGRELGISANNIDEEIYGAYLDQIVQLNGDTNADATGKAQVQGDITTAADVRSYLQGLDYDTTGLSNEDLLAFAGTGLGIDLGTATSDYQTANETITQRDARVEAERVEEEAKQRIRDDITAAMDDPDQDGGAFNGSAAYVEWFINNHRAEFDNLDAGGIKTRIQGDIDRRRYTRVEVANDIKAAFPADADLSVEDLMAKYPTLFDLAGEGNHLNEGVQKAAFDEGTITGDEANAYFRDVLGYGEGWIPTGNIASRLVGVGNEATVLPEDIANLTGKTLDLYNETTITEDEVIGAMIANPTDFGFADYVAVAQAVSDGLDLSAYTGRYWQAGANPDQVIPKDKASGLLDRLDDATVSQDEIDAYLTEQGYDPATAGTFDSSLGFGTTSVEDITSGYRSGVDAERQTAADTQTIKDALAATGLTMPADFDYAGFLPRAEGQSDFSWGTAIPYAVEGYKKSRQYTRAEAIADLETELGRSLTQEEIDNKVYDSFLAEVVQLDGDTDADATGKTQVETDITNDADVRSYLEGLGYTPTEEEISAFAGTGLGIDLGTTTAEYRSGVDAERQTAADTQTIKDALAATGLTMPAGFDYAGFLPRAEGQSDFSWETAIPYAVDAYKKSRQYTRAEAIADLETELGRSLTQEEIDNKVYDSFLAEVVQLDGDTDADATGKTQVETDITNDADVRSYLEGLGYTPTEEEISAFAGTGLGIDLGTTTAEYRSGVDADRAEAEEIQRQTDAITAALDDATQDGGAYTPSNRQGYINWFLNNKDYAGKTAEQIKASIYDDIDNKRYTRSEVADDLRAAFPADAGLSIEDLEAKYAGAFDLVKTGAYATDGEQRTAFGAATTTEAEARESLENQGYVIPEGFDFTNFTGVMNSTELANNVYQHLSPLQYTRGDAEAALAAELGRPLTAEDLTTYKDYLDGLVDMTGATTNVIGDAQVQGDITSQADINAVLLGAGYSQTDIDAFNFDDLIGLGTDLDTELSGFTDATRTIEQQDTAADLLAKGWTGASDTDIAEVQGLDSTGRDAWIAERQFTRDQAIAALAVHGIDANHRQFESLITQLIVDKGEAGTPTTQGALVDNPEDALIDEFITTQDEVDAEFGKYSYFDPTNANIPTGVHYESTLEGLVQTHVGNNYVQADAARAELNGIAGVDAYEQDLDGNYVITDDQLLGMGLAGQYDPTTLGDKVNAATTTEEEVIAAFGEGYTPTEEEIARYVGLLPDGDIGTTIPAYVADRMNTLVSDVGDLSLTVSQLQDQLNGALADGGSLDQAVTEVADALGIAEDALLKLIGDNSNKFDDLEAAFGTQATDDQEATGIWANIAGLEGDVVDLQDAFGTQGTTTAGEDGILGTEDDVVVSATGIYGIIDQVAEGVLSNDEAIAALQGVVGEPATYAEDGVTVLTPATGIYAQSGTGVNAEVLAAIDAVYDYVGNEGFASGASLDEVAAVVGKSAQEVTQEDIDAVNQMVTNNIGTELAGTGAELAYDELYDVNRDGVVNITDAELLTAVQSGDYSTYSGQLSTDSQFANTGFYDIFDQNRYAQEQAAIETERQRQLDLETQAAIDAQIQADMNTQINAQISAQQDAEKRSLLYSLAASQPQQTKPAEPYVAPFKQRYNWESIFSSEQEEADRERISPYGGYSPEPEQGTKAAATGGLITDESDELLALLGLE